MTAAELHRRASELFLAAYELPADQRAAFLDEACHGDASLRAAVDTLLASDRGAESQRFLESPAAGTGFRMEMPLEGRPIEHAPRPERIGPYRILNVLGRGGMGLVYLAEQDRPRRDVALKVIRPGLLSPAALRRFERETNVLARLHHPGIAQIYDAGMAGTGADTQPYFAMELVSGRPLVEHAAEKQLDLRERLELFTRICDAVQHAHEKGVIHRDLKPGNILIDDSGQPKILDFGVARAVEPGSQAATVQTSAGEIVGTLPYMSPEQLAASAGQLDAGVDVYALGALLYELVSGRLPLDLSDRPLPEAARIIREEDPPRLGTLDRTWRGDLEAIASKALEKERSRRYASVLDLAEDVRRHLADQPIAAEPPSTIYQLRKFARRNKALVGGVAAVFVALILGLVATLWQAREARREANNALAINNFWRSVLISTDPSVAGQDVSMADVLEFATRLIDTDGAFVGRADLKADLHVTLGIAFERRGRYPDAEKQLRSALDLQAPSKGESDPAALMTKHELAIVLYDQHRLDEALPLYNEAYEGFRRQQGSQDRDTLTVAHDLALCLQELGRLDEAETVLRETWARQRDAFGNDDPETLTTASSLGNLLRQTARFDEAEPLLRQTLELRRRRLGDRDVETLNSLNKLGVMLLALNRLDEAEPLLSEALAGRRARLMATHPDTLNSMSVLAMLYIQRRDYASAEPLLRETLAGRRNLLRQDHPDTLSTLGSLAFTLCNLNQLDEAAELFAEALPAAEGQLDSDAVANLQASYGQCLLRLHRYEQAEPLLLQVLDAVRGSRDLERITRGLLVQLYEGWGRPDDAAKWRAPPDAGTTSDPAEPASR